MKTLLFLTLMASTLLGTRISRARTCVDAFPQTSGRTNNTQAQSFSGEFLDLSFLPGTAHGAFELLPPGGMVTAQSAFVCTHCGAPTPPITEVPNPPRLQCDGCGKSVSMSQRQIPPALVIRDGPARIYAWRPNIIRDPQVIEYFHQEPDQDGKTYVFGCSSCGTRKTNPLHGEPCTNCGDKSESRLATMDLKEVEYQDIRDNPEAYYPTLIRMGLLDPLLAREMNLVSSRELFEMAEQMVRTELITWADAFRRNFVGPREAVERGWITALARDRAMVEVLTSEDGAPPTVTVTEAIAKGWISKRAAVEHDFISESEAGPIAVIKPGSPYFDGPGSSPLRARFSQLANRIPRPGRRTAPSSSALSTNPQTTIHPEPPVSVFSQMSPRVRKTIFVGAVALATLTAATTAVLFSPFSARQGPIAQGQVTHISEALVVFENSAAQERYAGQRIDIDSPPPGIRVVREDFASQIRLLEPSSQSSLQAQGRGHVVSILVLNINGTEIKYYRQGPITSNFSNLTVGDEVNIQGPGLFDYQLAQ